MKENNCFCCFTYKDVSFYPDLVREQIYLCPGCLSKIGACLINGHNPDQVHRVLRNKLKRQKRRSIRVGMKEKNNKKVKRKKTNRKEYF